MAVDIACSKIRSSVQQHCYDVHIAVRMLDINAMTPNPLIRIDGSESSASETQKFQTLFRVSRPFRTLEVSSISFQMHELHEEPCFRQSACQSSSTPLPDHQSFRTEG